MQLHPKVTASVIGSGVGGALVLIVVWILSLYNVTVPDNVAQSLTILVGALLALVSGYSVSSPPSGS